MLNFKNFGRKPEAKWYFKEKSIQALQTDRISFTITRTMVSMTIKNVTKVDGGVYTVKISNNVSDASAEFTLAVRDKPDKPKGENQNWQKKPQKKDDYQSLYSNVPNRRPGPNKRPVGDNAQKSIIVLGRISVLGGQFSEINYRPGRIFPHLLIVLP